MAAKDHSREWLAVLRDHGLTPIAFIEQQLLDARLLLFDDGLHSAYEPWAFYVQMVQTPSVAAKLSHIFIETVSVSSQPAIDAFLGSVFCQPELLAPVFQNDLGFGWRYETLLDLFMAVREANGNRSDGCIKIQAVGPPIVWAGILNHSHYKEYLDSLRTRDYFMYLKIMESMETWRESDRGLFLTNTRHAYTGLKDVNNRMIWNCGTFFRQWHPGLSFSVRIHNWTLRVLSASPIPARTTAEGLEMAEFEWTRMAEGIWDEAFAANSNVPVGFLLEGTLFGTTAYAGGQMLFAHPEARMQDAYDGLVFLAPLEALHDSAKIDSYYTDAFRHEIERRLLIIYDGDIETILSIFGQPSLPECVVKLTEPIPRVPATRPGAAPWSRP